MQEQAPGGFLPEDSLEGLRKIYARHQHQAGSTIAILQDIQQEFGYLPEAAVNWIADRLDQPRSQFFGVATFYSQFYFKPRGKNIITVCCGTACHVKGSEKILAGLQREFNLTDEENTTEDLHVTVEKVNCVGACSIAPVVIINNNVHGKAATGKILKQTRTLVKGQSEND